MKRPLLVLVLACTILGTLALYSQFLATLPAREKTPPATQMVTAKFRLEVTLTCPVEADAFALDRSTALLVRHAGNDLIRSGERVPPTAELFAELPQLSTGRHLFFVQATPASEMSQQANALRLRLLKDEQPIAETTIWSRPGEMITGEWGVEISPNPATPKAD